MQYIDPLILWELFNIGNCVELSLVNGWNAVSENCKPLIWSIMYVNIVIIFRWWLLKVWLSDTYCYIRQGMTISGNTAKYGNLMELLKLRSEDDALLEQYLDKTLSMCHMI